VQINAVPQFVGRERKTGLTDAHGVPTIPAPQYRR
jgi:hypothetical protein